MDIKITEGYKIAKPYVKNKCNKNGVHFPHPPFSPTFYAEI
jgi:hypothetical protein